MWLAQSVQTPAWCQWGQDWYLLTTMGGGGSVSVPLCQDELCRRVSGSSIHPPLLPEIQFKSDDLPGVSVLLSLYADGNSCLCNSNNYQHVHCPKPPTGKSFCWRLQALPPPGTVAFVVQTTQLGSKFSSANHLPSLSLRCIVCKDEEVYASS